VDVPADSRMGRTAREALLIVRRAVVKIQRPDKLETRSGSTCVYTAGIQRREMGNSAGIVAWSSCLDVE
jgi:hypothetical protein